MQRTCGCVKDKELMDKSELAKLFTQFNFFPVLITPYALNKWYAEIDLKEGISSFGINRGQFENLLLEIAFNNQDFLQKFYHEKLQENDQANVEGRAGSRLGAGTEDFTKKTDMKVMPSMRVSKPEPAVPEKQQSARLLDSKDAGKKGQPAGGEVPLKSERSQGSAAPSAGKSKGVGEKSQPSMLSLKDSAQDELEGEESEHRMDALEGLMLYVGISESKKDMKALIRTVMMGDRSTSPTRLEHCRIVVDAAAKKLKEKYNLATPKPAKAVVKERTIDVPKPDLIKFDEGLYVDKIAEMEKSDRAKSARSTGSQKKPGNSKRA